MREFGPASALTDTQLVTLVDYCSDIIDQDSATTVLELLQGRTWDWLPEDGQVPQPVRDRILRLTQAAPTVFAACPPAHLSDLL